MSQVMKMAWVFTVMLLSNMVASVPSKALCHKIVPALKKTGSTDIVKMKKKDAFSW